VTVSTVDSVIATPSRVYPDRPADPW
jgi:hypothetical protein